MVKIQRSECVSCERIYFYTLGDCRKTKNQFCTKSTCPRCFMISYLQEHYGPLQCPQPCEFVIEEDETPLVSSCRKCGRNRYYYVRNDLNMYCGVNICPACVVIREMLSFL